MICDAHYNILIIVKLLSVDKSLIVIIIKNTYIKSNREKYQCQSTQQQFLLIINNLSSDFMIMFTLSDIETDHFV